MRDKGKRYETAKLPLHDAGDDPPCGKGSTGECPEVCELPPWADPLVARLLAKYRLEAALADSLNFLQQDGQPPKLHEDRLPPWGSVPANSDS